MGKENVWSLYSEEQLHELDKVNESYKKCLD